MSHSMRILHELPLRVSQTRLSSILRVSHSLRLDLRHGGRWCHGVLGDCNVPAFRQLLKWYRLCYHAELWLRAYVFR